MDRLNDFERKEWSTRTKNCSRLALQRYGAYFGVHAPPLLKQGHQRKQIHMTLYPFRNPPSEKDKAPGFRIRKIYEQQKWLQPILHDCYLLANDCAADWCESDTEEERIQIVDWYERQRNELFYEGLKRTTLATFVHGGILSIWSTLYDESGRVLEWVLANPFKTLFSIALVVVGTKLLRKRK